MFMEVGSKGIEYRSCIHMYLNTVKSHESEVHGTKVYFKITIFWNVHCVVCCVLMFQNLLPPSLIHEINTYLLDYTASHPRKQLPSQTLLSESQI
jgi:hypothetical protein